MGTRPFRSFVCYLGWVLKIGTLQTRALAAQPFALCSAWGVLRPPRGRALTLGSSSSLLLAPPWSCCAAFVLCSACSGTSLVPHSPRAVSCTLGGLRPPGDPTPMLRSPLCPAWVGPLPGHMLRGLRAVFCMSGDAVPLGTLTPRLRSPLCSAWVGPPS
jgi:hypothetical protein